MAHRAHRVDSVELASYILAECGPMPHLKLQKLAYYVQAWHLALLDEALIDDDFQAWVHGPVSRKIWDHFKDENSPLMGSIQLDVKSARKVKESFPKSLTAEQMDLIDDVLEEYGQRSAYHLECLTHSERPWIDARKGLGIADKSTQVISKAAISKFYRTKALSSQR